MSALFNGQKTCNPYLTGWDIYMFFNAKSFNQPLTFDTSSATTLAYMFRGATSFNQPLTFSDTTLVTRMDSMFYGASSFNQPLSFDTSKVYNFAGMFRGATSGFNQPIDFQTPQMASGALAIGLIIANTVGPPAEPSRRVLLAMLCSMLGPARAFTCLDAQPLL